VVCSAERAASDAAKKRSKEYNSRPDIKEARKRYNKKYHAERVWTEEHRVKALAATNKWRKNNLEKARELDRQYAAKRADQRRAYNREYAKRNAEKLATKERNKRAIKLRNGGRHTKEDIAEILLMQRGKCAYCRVKLGKKYHVDHIIPSVKGGSNGRENLQILCALCNHKKHARDPVEFAQSLGFLL
jgi:5-methylcytosine-specific restriction endonuclease McrA